MGKVHALMARRQLARGETVEVGHKQPEVEVAERIPLVEVGVVRVLQMAVEEGSILQGVEAEGRQKLVELPKLAVVGLHRPSPHIRR
jgi:hypothetical protein